MKSIIRFLLRTEAGKLIVQTLISLVIKVVKKRIDRLPFEKRADVLSVLDLAHDEIHADVTVITDSL